MNKLRTGFGYLHHVATVPVAHHGVRDTRRDSSHGEGEFDEQFAGFL